MASQAESLLILLSLSALTFNVLAADVSINLDVEAAAGHKGNIVDLYDPVLRLNRQTFQDSILQEHADEASHWVVLFCPTWYEPCQSLEAHYRQLTVRWQDQLNSGLLSTEVGFASVDCATEKALCNTQNVGMKYPFVAHYRQRKQVAVWKGKSFETDAKRLTAFLQRRLGAASAASSATPESDDAMAEDMQKFPVDFLMIFVIIAANAWIMSRK